jgi:hypothetical protein
MPAALADTVRHYGAALAAMEEGAAYSDALDAALAAARNAAAGESEAMATLRRHLSEDLVRNADTNTARLAGAAPPGVNVAALPEDDRLSAATCLADLGFAADDRAGVQVGALEEVAGLNRIANQTAAVALCPDVHRPGHWDSRPGAFSYGGFGHGGLLTRTGPDGAPQCFRLIGGRFHQATKSKRVLSISTEIGLTVLPVRDGTDGELFADFGPEILPNAATPVEPSTAGRFHTKRGHAVFHQRTGTGQAIGWSSGNGHSKHGYAIFASVCRTAEYTDRLAQVSRYRSSKSLGKKVPLVTHATPAETAEIADRLAPNDPFSAYYAPEVTPPDDLVVFASPYLKVVSGGRDSGPAIILWLRAYREATSGKIVRDRLRRSHELFFL